MGYCAVEVTNLVIGNLKLTTVESNRNSGSSDSNSDSVDLLLSIVQNQPNYIKRLYIAYRTEKLYTITSLRKKQKLIFKNLLKAIR